MPKDKDFQYEALQSEIVKLFGHIQKVKEEIASIKHPQANIDHFATIADKLDAIVETTEKATSDIMEATEAILDLVNKAHVMVSGGEVGKIFNDITDCANHIFEACSFHDLTGQRISKIVRTMNLIEGSLNSMVVIVGEKAIAALPVTVKDIDATQNGDAPMHGPQREGHGVSQADIDKLFD